MGLALSTADICLLLTALLGLATGVALLLPLRLALRLQGSSEPQSSTLDYLCVLRHGVVSARIYPEKPGGWRPALSVHGGGLRLHQRPLLPTAGPTAPEPRVSDKTSRTFARIDWVETAELLLLRWRVLTVKQLVGSLQLGLSDAAQTGQLAGLLWALAGLNPSGLELRLTPVFERSVIDGELQLELSVHPARLLGAVVHVLWTTTRQRETTLRARAA